MDSTKELYVPIYEKYALTISEGAKYFNIGDKKLRKIVTENLDSGLVLQYGNKYLIKRKKFEAYLDELTSL